MANDYALPRLVGMVFGEWWLEAETSSWYCPNKKHELLV